MKETGMVRRLDDLGRLVIPKEIRKMYKMKEGDSIEIYIKEGSVCIRKFDELSEFFEQIEKICDILQTKYDNTIFFTSDEYLHKNQLHIEEKVLEKALVHRSTFFDTCKIYIDKDVVYAGYICPVVHHGNYYGSFIQVFDTTNCSEKELETMDLFAQLLANQQHE